MRPMMVVIHPPRFDLAPRVLDRQELIGVQTLIAQLAVEGLDEAVFYRLPGPNEIQQHTPSVCPVIEHAVPEEATDLTVAVVGEPRAARILPQAIYDPSGARMRPDGRLDTTQE
jgi:hypothetical protein